MLKNVTIASIISLVLIIGASQPVQALTADEVQSQIRLLLDRVSELTAQIRLLQGQGSTASSPSSGTASYPSAPRICTSAMRSLAEGSEGDDVRAFQEFLQSEGFFSGSATGFFGPLTRAALMRWQGANGMESAGIVGPKTSALIRQRCGFSVDSRFSAQPKSGSAPLSVTFSAMVGGFTPFRYAVDFGDGSTSADIRCSSPADACVSPGTVSHTYTAGGSYTAILVQYPANGTINDANRVVLGREFITVGSGATGACTKEYAPICGAKPVTCITTPCNPVPTTYGNRCTMNADGASYLYEGSCRATSVDPSTDSQCKAWFDGCNTCSRQSPGGIAACTLRYCLVPQTAYCTAHFDDSNRAPSISGLTGPTTLAVGESGTWKISASDPENGPLSYSVNWGEANATLNSSAVGSSASFTQSTTFSHSYATAGTYTVSVLVTDSAGAAARTSTTVKVGTETVVCTMQYDPVCGRPPGCANTCQPGQICPAICQLQTPQTYGNRCTLNGAGAQFLHTGQCTATSGSFY